MKDVLVDVFKLRSLYTGLGQFSLNFIEALKSSDLKNLNIVLLIPPGFDSSISKEFDRIEAGFKHRLFPGLNRKFDLWHSLQQFPSHFPMPATRQILTVHDLNFLIEKNENKANRYLAKLQKNIDRSIAVTTISNATKLVLEKYIDTRYKPVKVIYNGAKLDLSVSDAKPGFVTHDKYLFAIGVFNQKKNFEVLIPMMKYFPGYQLIIAGDNDSSYGNTMRQLIQDAGLNHQVTLPGKISDADKSWLYQNCQGFMMPSQAEGFGLPVIEAMLAGKPVFLSNIDSLSEVGGNTADYFENFDAEQMARLIEIRLLEFDKNKNSETDLLLSHAQQFTWKASIDAYLTLYNAVLND